MIWVDSERCKGCGACASACMVGAIRLVEGKAQINLEACIDCEACVYACPEHAILVISEPKKVKNAHLPVPQRALPAERRPSGLATRWVAKALPWAGAALSVVASELFPRLADALLGTLQRGEVRPSHVGSSDTGRGVGRGRAHRHRHGR